MPQPGRLRITIGDLVGLVALTGLVLAPRVQNLRASSATGNLAPYTLVASLFEIALAGVFFLNRRQSRWIWLIIGSLGFRSAFDLLWQRYLVSWAAFSDLLDGMIYLWVSHLLMAGFIAGLALMFGDIRRRLAVAEGLGVGPRAAATARPADGDAPPPGVS